MNKKITSIIAAILAIVLVLSLLLGLFASAASAATDRVSSSQIKQQIDKLKKENKELKSELKALEKDLDKNSDEIEDIMDQKDAVEQQLSLLHEQIHNINEQIAAYAVLIADKQEELEAAEKHLEEVNEKHKERIRAMEESGGVSYWSVIFGAKSFSDLLDWMNIVDEIATADQLRLQELETAAQEVAAAKDALKAEQESLETTKTEMAEMQAEQEKKSQEADVLLKQLVAKSDELEEAMEKYEKDLADAEQKQAELEHDYKIALDREEEEKRLNQYIASNGGGLKVDKEGRTWVIPCSYIRISSRFGYRTHPVTGEKQSFHKGVDFSAACKMRKDGTTGSPIYATRSGVVIRARKGTTEGWFVTIDHGDGFRSVYMHMCQKPFVQEGQTVYAGEVIGCIGTTGRSTGNHLHFGISLNGTYVNPLNYIG